MISAQRPPKTTDSHATGDGDKPLSKEVILNPRLGALNDNFVEFCSRVQSEAQHFQDSELIAATDQWRKEVDIDGLVAEADLALLFSKSVILDLVAQGWT